MPTYGENRSSACADANRCKMACSKRPQSWSAQAYIITTRRMTSGELLKYRNGLLMAQAYHGAEAPRAFGLTKPLTTFAPILISFSLRLVSDQTLIGSGVDSGHRFYFDKATDGVNRNENKPYAPAPATQPAIAA